MIPPRIRRGDPIGKLADYWNMLIDHLNESRLVPGRGVSISRMPAGTVIHTLNHAKAAGLGQAPVQKTEYNGYFTLKNLGQDNDSVANGTVKIAVCDGETWDNEEEKSGNSLAYINGVEYSRPSTVLRVGAEKPYIVLRVDHQKSPGQNDFFKIAAVEKVLDITNNVTDYVLGEVVFGTGKPALIQRHKGEGNGTPYIWLVLNKCMPIEEFAQNESTKK